MNLPGSRQETYQHDTVRSDFSGEPGGVDANIFLPPEVADPLRALQAKPDCASPVMPSLNSGLKSAAATFTATRNGLSFKCRAV